MKVVIILWMLAVAPGFSQWSLPYLRPEKYDYSELYNEELVLFQQNNPSGYSQELSRAWNYYKKTYIMSNGLVNHMRLDPNSQQLIGENEAVSEGQGYGMLLAVLNNDQATFNKIHQAANQHMWDGGRKSYHWGWKNGSISSRGSATDADEDIALALIFADALEKKGFWQPFSNPAYATRAREIIISIFDNVTQDGYLLPGDSWGGDAINNLNPSYFAVAWYKVFNAFQNERDFTRVINRCYEVIGKMPRYNKGQAPDWMTASGGRASKGGLDMGNDGFRTPWRIAMDALWYDDSRARAYCINTKNTLTNYKSSSVQLLAQMGMYDESGNIITTTRGYPEAVAMWSSAILGSKDTEYATNALKGRIISQITGSYHEFFGDASLQDHKFYFKQSIAMLGYAAILGMFPNIYEDYTDGSMDVTGIQLVDPLTTSAAMVYVYPVQLTAKIESPADWTVTLSGQTTGFTAEFTGSGTDIQVSWDGAEVTQKELVTARLSVAGLAHQSDPSVLQTGMQIMSLPTGIARPPGRKGSGLFSLNSAGRFLRLQPLKEDIRPLSLDVHTAGGRRMYHSSLGTALREETYIFTLPEAAGGSGLRYILVTYQQGGRTGQWKTATAFLEW